MSSFGDMESIWSGQANKATKTAIQVMTTFYSKHLGTEAKVDKYKTAIRAILDI